MRSPPEVAVPCAQPLLAPSLVAPSLVALPLVALLLAPPLPAQEQAPPAPVKEQPAAPSLTKEYAEAIAAYAAKIAASAVFISGRTIESVMAEEFAPDAPLQTLARPFLKFDVDDEQRTLTASLLGKKATAAFVDGLGCTLVRGADVAALRARALLAATIQADPRPWPLGDDVVQTDDDHGVDRKALAAALDYAFKDREGRAPARTRAVVVVHRGRVVGERYAEGYTAESVLPGWSMTKTWVHALLGLRMKDGALDPDAALPVPEWQGENDPRAALRLEDLLRMQSGLEWSEDYEAPGSLALRMLFASDDFAGVAASQKLAAPPRTVHLYSSGTSNLLCRILRTTFKQESEYLAFARDRLFRPLRMRGALLEPDPSGTFVGSSFGFARARDWAKFGLLYLKDGVWDGERLLPEGWIAAARKPTDTSRRGSYGAHLWLNAGAKDNPDDRPFPKLPRDLFYLSGFEGQYVVCLPEQQIVVVRLGCTRRGGFDLSGVLERVLAACGT